MKTPPKPKPEPDASQTRLFSRRSLCERWEVSIDFLRRLEELGELHPVLLSPRALRYRETEIEAYENKKLMK